MTDSMATLVGTYPGAFASETVAEALLILRKRDKHTDPARVAAASAMALSCEHVLSLRQQRELGA